MLKFFAHGLQTNIVSTLKKLGVPLAKLKCAPDQKQLALTVILSAQQFLEEVRRSHAPEPLLHIGQELPPGTVIHWPAVIWINEAEIPQFSALIKIGHSR